MASCTIAQNAGMTLPTLILLPGLMCDATVWQPQLDGLSDLADLRVPDYGSLDSLGAMAEAVIAAAPPRFAVAGHSMGGRVALEVLRRAPDCVTRLALLDTGHHARPEGAAGDTEAQGRHRLLAIAREQGVAAMARDWVQGMVHPRRLADTALIDAIVAMFASKSADIFAAQIRALLARPEAEGVLATYRGPTLLLAGREDGWSPPARHAEMAELVPGSRLTVIDDCGHMSTMEQPEAVNAALRTWLAA